MGVLDGKVAIVTGAGRGIGRSHALLLASEGAQVVVNDLGGEWDGVGADNRPAQTVVEEIEAAGGKAVANYDNCATFEGAEGLVRQAVEHFGDLNILVNNAGILRDKMLFNMTEDDWDSVINVHLKGHFAPSHFAVSYWRQKSKAGEEVYGRIINTSSESGLFGNAGQANYAAAKAGIVSLTWVLARECQKMGVTANAIAPRARTRMTEGTFGGFNSVSDTGFDMVAPENISPLVGYLASPAAGSVSGQVFIVWGDEVQVVKGFEGVAMAKNNGERWTVDGLIAAAPQQLWAERDPGVPAFGVPLPPVK
jgi:NAD(P)-dependent dehydrogenase (short-subunit alcohol dehydrogenase family)